MELVAWCLVGLLLSIVLGVVIPCFAWGCFEWTNDSAEDAMRWKWTEVAGHSMKPHTDDELCCLKREAKQRGEHIAP